MSVKRMSTTWNYRVVRYAGEGFGLHECYWKGDKMVSRTERAILVSETFEGISEQLGVMARDAKLAAVDDIDG